MGDCYTFREQLAIRYPTLGYALWEPDPGGLYNTVDVGDVGFIREGIFYRLFNTLLPKGDPSNPRPDSQRSSTLPPQLQPRESEHVRKSRDNCKCFHSKNVTKESHAHKSGAYGSRPDDRQVTFSCSGGRGALSYLPLSAERKDTVARGDFGRWMVNNIDHCMRVAEDLGLGTTSMEDIILVTGCHLARSWVNVSFSDDDGGARVSFEARKSGSSGVDLKEGDVNGGDVKFGPRGKNLLENQCIFVRGYRVFPFPNFRKKFKAMAESSDMPEPSPVERLEPKGLADGAKDKSPLHILLNYIVAKAPGCDMALINDNDLKCLEDAPRPDKLMEFLKRQAPIIFEVPCELSSGKLGGSAAKSTVTVTAATLSKEVFDALQGSNRPGPDTFSQHGTKSEQSREQPGHAQPRPATGKSSSLAAAPRPSPKTSAVLESKGAPPAVPEDKPRPSQPRTEAAPTSTPRVSPAQEPQNTREDTRAQNVNGHRAAQVHPTAAAPPIEAHAKRRPDHEDVSGSSPPSTQSSVNSKRTDQVRRTASVQPLAWSPSVSPPALDRRGMSMSSSPRGRDMSRTRPDHTSQNVMSVNNTANSDQLPRVGGSRLADNHTGTSGHRDTSGLSTAPGTRSPRGQRLAGPDESDAQDSKRNHSDDPPPPSIPAKSQQDNVRTGEPSSRRVDSKAHSDRHLPSHPEHRSTDPTQASSIRTDTRRDVKTITSHSPPVSDPPKPEPSWKKYLCGCC